MNTPYDERFYAYKDDLVNTIIDNFQDSYYDAIAQRIVEDDVNRSMYSSVVYDIMSAWLQVMASDAIYAVVLEPIAAEDRDYKLASHIFQNYMDELIDEVCEEVGSSYKLVQRVNSFF